MKVVCLNGSPNKNGNTKEMLNILTKRLKIRNINCEIIDIMEALRDVKQSFCINCSKPCNEYCFKDTYLEDTFNKITEADVFVIASPVYFGNVTAQIKAFFDKTRNIRKNKQWIGKKAVSMSVGHSDFGGQEITVNSLNNMLMVHGFTILNDGSHEFGAGHFGICAKEPIREDLVAIERINVVASRIEEEIKE